jgi:outer membrane receptor protein involved in Fe transport
LYTSTGVCLATILGSLAWSTVIAAESDDRLVEIIVTGSRLSSGNASSPSPVFVLDNEEILHQGTARAEDLLNSLPQVDSTLTLGANGASAAPVTGTATVDLRGIGAFRTLVLMNGKRTAPGDPINPSTDLNTIPTGLIKRVEVLTGGASAIYGSDAIAGVVNFILDNNFKGFKVDAEVGINRASNDRGDLQAIERASGINAPTGTVYDGRAVDLSVIFGQDVFDGSGHVTAYAGYRQSQRVTGASRDTSACTLTETTTSYACLLDGTTPGGVFIPNGGAPLTLDTANGHAFRALSTPGDLYNPGTQQDLQRPDTRYNAGVFTSYKFNEAVNFYGELQYTDDTSTARFEPSGTSLTQLLPAPYSVSPTAYNIGCSNPLLSASQVNDLCTSAGLGPTQSASVLIGRRNLEGGQRSDEFHHQSYRIVAGLKGEISEPWSYDVSVYRGRVNARESLSNDISVVRLGNALNVVSVGGIATCQSVVDGTDPACVPYNIYSVGGVTPAALKYIRADGRQSGYAERTVVSGQLVGELEKYGVKSPFANTGVGVALGAEYRTESVSYHQNASYAAGDLLATAQSPILPTVGTFRVSEVFSEVKVPLIEDRPFAKKLVLNLSDRYAHYTPQGNVNAFGIGLEWAPLDPVRLRGSISRAVRAPNDFELYTSQVLGTAGIIDPCAGPVTATTPTLAQCARSGVTAAEYGNISAQTAVNVLTGGNPKLKPETADTVTVGIVLTPLNNLLFSADYWRIKVKQFVGVAGGGPAIALSNCLNNGDPFYCALIRRDSAGSLSLGSGPTAGRIVQSRVNTGSYGTSGVDFEGRYLWDLTTLRAKAGSLAFSFSGSVALDNPIAVTPGAPETDCSGYFGPTCSGAGPTSPVPRWHHRLRTTWENKNGLALSLNWRHIGKLKYEGTSSQAALANPAQVFAVDSRIGAYDYFDLDGSFDVTERLNLRLGVNNLADRKPPVIGSLANPALVNGNMAAGFYDVLGRYLFVGFSAKY